MDDDEILMGGTGERNISGELELELELELVVGPAFSSLSIDRFCLFIADDINSNNLSCIALTSGSARLHIMIHPSPPTDSKYRPSGEKRTDVINSLWPVTCATKSPEKKSNKLIVLSNAQDATKIPMKKGQKVKNQKMRSNKI